MKITYESKVYEVEKGTTVGETFKEQIEKSEIKEIIAARLNNTIVSLKTPITEDGEIEFFNRQDKDGRIIYIRGLLFLMCKAFSEVYPEALLTVNYQLSNAMFGEIDNMEVTDEVIENVKAKMQEIIDKDLPITKVMMTQEEAEEF